MATSSTRLSLVVIRAIDIEATARFYSALGLSFTTEQHGKGPLHLVSNAGGFVFEVYPRKPDGPATTAARLGFTTADLDTALDALTAAGGRILTGPTATPCGRAAVVVDPEGHKVEVTEA